jgi:hypothetical protein
MTALPRDYDAWRLSCPYDDFDGVGECEGETCNRVHEPDEDAPRNYRPRPCGGIMVADDGEIICESCGELA